MRARLVVVVGGGGDTVKVVRVGVFAPLGEESEVFQDIVLGVASDPCAKRSQRGVWSAGLREERARGESPGGEVAAADRISLYIWFITRCSACLMATSSPRASHSQAIVAGAWQMAQSGSILMTALRGLGDLACILTMIVGPRLGEGGHPAVEA